jgi:hypothetical protein
LQTPTYVICLLLIFFLILTLGFEYTIHALQRTLRKRGREGLVQAVDKAVLELTLLGFVSLILILFQDYIPEICIKYKDSQAEWTLLENLSGCPCCLSTTYGITTCAMMSHTCAFNETTKQPFCGCNLGWPESTYDTTLEPNATDYCTPYETKEDQFIFNSAIGSLINEISPTEFCNYLTNGSVSDADFYPPTSTESGRRRSLLAAAASDANLSSEGLHVVPEFTTFRCEGPFNAGSCSSGSHPAISYNALHQIHLLIFVIAAMHVVVSVIVAIIAGMRIKQWRRWQNEDIVHGPHHLVNKTLSGGDGKVEGTAAVEVDVEKRKYESLLSNLEENPLPLEVEGERGGAMITSGGKTVVGDVKNEENAADVDGDAPPPAADAPESVANSSIFVSEVQDAAKKVQRHWMRRDSRLLRKRHRLGEAAICVGQALLPNLVSQYEFSTMRVAYVGSHNLPETYDWVNELMIHLDFDLVKIIGASLVTWGIFILEWLFSGLAGWVSSVFMLIASLTVFAINIYLVAAIRFCCRGGRPHRIRNITRWYNNPNWLCLPIGGIIFLCSTTFSTALFFWWQFGGNSCFFTNYEQQIWKWLPGNLPWYCGLIGPAVLLVWIAYVTVPAWALIMHMRPKAVLVEAAEKKKEGGEGETHNDGGGRDVDVEKQGSGERRTQAVVMAEIHKLQTELMELQAPS